MAYGKVRQRRAQGHELADQGKQVLGEVAFREEAQRDIHVSGADQQQYQAVFGHDRKQQNPKQHIELREAA